MSFHRCIGKGVQWAEPPILTCGLVHQKVGLGRHDSNTLVSWAGIAQRSGSC